jgi:hypothetical protein
MTDTPNKLPCPNAANHTPAPTGYLEWQDWAAKKAKTHKQINHAFYMILNNINHFPTSRESPDLMHIEMVWNDL